METNLYIVKQEDYPDLINHDLTFEIIKELDYILLKHKELDNFGYGDTLKDAINMLIECLRTTKQDLETGLIHRGNFDESEYLLLRDTFNIVDLIQDKDRGRLYGIRSIYGPPQNFIALENFPIPLFEGNNNLELVVMNVEPQKPCKYCENTGETRSFIVDKVSITIKQLPKNFCSSCGRKLQNF